jgi:uncharacterized Tic20 family protein
MIVMETANVPNNMPPEATARRDENMWAMLCHLSSLAGFVIPFGNIIGPLAIWLIKKDEYPLVNDQGKESLNFQISITIYLIAAAILVIILIGLPILIILALADLVLVVLASIRANEGEKFRYPFAIKFIV